MPMLRVMALTAKNAATLTAQPNTPVLVDARLTAAADPAMNEKALDILENLQVQVAGR